MYLLHYFYEGELVLGLRQADMTNQGNNQNPEQIARDHIDRKLVDAGWNVQDKNQIDLKKVFEGRLLNDSELATCRKEPDWCPAEELLA